MKIIVAIIIALIGYSIRMPVEASEYAVALLPAPVLNSPDFSAVFGKSNKNILKTDRCGQVRELEFIALRGAVFTIIKKQRTGTIDIFQVETDEYTASPSVRLYVDARFFERVNSVPMPRMRSLPPRDAILVALKHAIGRPYVWGSNVLDGIPEVAPWSRNSDRNDVGGRRILDGLDCSGLLYYATNGWTPRNTSQLISVGTGVVIAGKKSTEIAALLQPLDLIVWNGHVIIVLDQQTAIESRLDCGKPGNGGVVLSALSQRLAEIMRSRNPADAWPDGKKRQDLFVVRRWYIQQ